MEVLRLQDKVVEYLRAKNQAANPRRSAPVSGASSVVSGGGRGGSRNKSGAPSVASSGASQCSKHSPRAISPVGRKGSVDFPEEASQPAAPQPTTSGNGSINMAEAPSPATQSPASSVSLATPAVSPLRARVTSDPVRDDAEANLAEACSSPTASLPLAPAPFPPSTSSPQPPPPPPSAPLTAAYFPPVKVVEENVQREDRADLPQAIPQRRPTPPSLPPCPETGVLQQESSDDVTMCISAVSSPASLADTISPRVAEAEGSREIVSSAETG